MYQAMWKFVLYGLQVEVTTSHNFFGNEAVIVLKISAAIRVDPMIRDNGRIVFRCLRPNHSVTLYWAARTIREAMRMEDKT
jgi:hypothetical protein